MIPSCSIPRISYQSAFGWGGVLLTVVRLIKGAALSIVTEEPRQSKWKFRLTCLTMSADAWLTPTAKPLMAYVGSQTQRSTKLGKGQESV
jgi:hypothetical protein